MVFGNQKLKKMNQIISIDSKEDIFPEYRNTPIEWLFEYHNLGRQFDTFEKAQLLVGMCMDNRKHLHMPDNFAYIIRSGGANLRHSEFKVSYAIAVGQISHIVLLAHNHCGMVNLFSRKNEFIQGLVDYAGWNQKQAEEHFIHFAPLFEIGNELEFVLSESKRLRNRYPNIQVAPLYYKVEDNRLYLVKEE